MEQVEVTSEERRFDPAGLVFEEYDFLVYDPDIYGEMDGERVREWLETAGRDPQGVLHATRSTALANPPVIQPETVPGKDVLGVQATFVVKEDRWVEHPNCRSTSVSTTASTIGACEHCGSEVQEEDSFIEGTGTELFCDVGCFNEAIQ